jgi:hypothetical protein
VSIINTCVAGFDRAFGGLGCYFREAIGFFVAGDTRVTPNPEEPAFPKFLQSVPKQSGPS